MKPWITQLRSVDACTAEVKNIIKTFEKHGIKIEHAEYLIEARRELCDRALELGAQPAEIKKLCP
jgi:hypothetical protein